MGPPKPSPTPDVKMEPTLPPLSLLPNAFDINIPKDFGDMAMAEVMQHMDETLT